MCETVLLWLQFELSWQKQKTVIWNTWTICSSQKDPNNVIWKPIFILYFPHNCSDILNLWNSNIHRMAYCIYVKELARAISLLCLLINSNNKECACVQHLHKCYVFASDIQRASANSCIISDNSGRLWYLKPPILQEILLSSSRGSGHHVFAVQSQYTHSEGKT